MLSVLVAVLTITAVIVRPGNRHEWVYATAGAAVLAVAGLLGVGTIETVWQRTGPVVVFLLAATFLGAAADRAGVFDVLAGWLSRVSRGSARRLLVAVVVLALAVTSVLSLDATVVLLTPAVVALARRTGAPVLPLALAVVYVANTGSLLSPVANLTNLLVAPRLGGAETFAATMLPVQIAALVPLTVLLLIWHRQALRVPVAVAAPAPVPSRFAFGVAAGAILALVPVLVLTEGWRLAAATSLVAVLAWAAGWRLPPDRPKARVPWRLGVFVMALFVVVDVAASGPLGAAAERTLADNGPVVAGLVGGLSANLLNNLPAFLLLSPAATDGPQLLGLLVGVNVGPNLATIGSLATLLWLSILRQHDLAPSPLTYLRWGLVVTPLTLLPALLVLAATT